MTPLIPGDFNSDGTVDGADYVLMRKEDWTQPNYTQWRENFGTSLVFPIDIPIHTPEPSTATLIVSLIAILLLRRQSRGGGGSSLPVR